MSTISDHLALALGDAYTIERELTGGGMSQVFVARDNALGRTVVVKVLPPDLAMTVSVDRFKREIMLSAALQHPHIVPVLRAGEAEGLPFFIMPFVEGESLRSRIARGPLSIRETVSIMKDVALALAYAQGRGIIHRDIKPDNILLSGGAAIVTDFGVAKAISVSREPGAGGRQPGAGSRTITHVGTSLGTPAYMAPEQAAADPSTDHRADIYALGIVGYEMLVGAPPFYGRTPQALLAAQLTEMPTPIAGRRYDVPAALADVIMKCLEKEPAKRPRTATELVRALENPAVISGAFASSPASTSTARKRASARWATAIGAVLVVGTIGWRAVIHRPSATIGRDTPALARSARAPTVIAVGPFAGIGTDSSSATFASGMTGVIVRLLTKVPNVQVALRDGAAIGGSSTTSGADAPDRPKTAVVLEGTVEREGVRIRVVARMVSSNDGITLWSDVFDRPASDLFRAQDEVAQAIAGGVAAAIQKRGGTRDGPTPNDQ